MTQSGIFLLTFNSYSIDSWIVNSGAFDHMTGDPSLFCTNTPCSNRTIVKIANDSNNLVYFALILLAQIALLLKLLMVPLLQLLVLVVFNYLKILS